jgi:hypothetical protein
MTVLDSVPETHGTREPGLVRVFAANVSAEWIKLRSVRSTVWALLVTVVLTVGLGALLCLARVSRWDRLGRGERVGFDAAGFSLNGIFLAQLAIVVLGVLVMSSEYATGQIRATFGATPQRLAVLAAKVAVFSVVVLVTGAVAALAAFELGQSIFSSKHAGVALGDPGVLRAVLLAPVYLALLGAFSIGVAAILRRTAGAIATIVGLLLVAPIIVSFLPSPWNDDIGKYLPSSAGSAMFHVVRDPQRLSSSAGFLVIVGYTVVALALGAVLLGRRDA